MVRWRELTQLLPEMRAYSRSITFDRADADDLVSDAMERAIRSNSAPSSTPSLRHWMFRVIRNLNIDRIRKEKVRREYLETQSRLFDDIDSRSTGASAETQVLLLKALERIGRTEREIVILIDIMGFRYAEAADILDIPTGTVMSRISRARRALMRELVSDDRPTQHED